MASIPRYRQALDPRSGGKMVRARRTLRSRTPYDRPTLRTVGSEDNSNWIARLVLSPTRMIATGAGKLFSSVFGSESSSSSSSSGSETEDDTEDDNDDNLNSSPGIEGLKKSGTSGMIDFFRKEPQPGKKESKCAIEQLLMQETFSREECNRLTQIIKSRVVECPTTEEEGRRMSEIPNRTAGTDKDGPDLCSTAVLEARKWLVDKRLGSNSKLETEHGAPACTLNSLMSPMAIDDEVGSPVDVAKSYMRARPPWASPSMNHLQYKSPSSGMQLFKEETPYLSGGNSFSSSKLKRESPASGSWNIQEEIRRVRSRATEEMLKSLPSTKIDWSSFSSDYRHNLYSSDTDKLEEHKEEKVQYPTKPVDGTLTLSTDVSNGLPVLEIAQDGSGNEAILPDPIRVNDQQNQELETNMTIDAHMTTDGTDAQDLSRAMSSSRGPDTEQNQEEIAEEQNPTCSSHDKIATSVMPVDETCELLSEASIEVPNVNEDHTVVNENNTSAVNENDSVASGSQNSCSMHCEELSQELSKPNSRRIMAGKTSGIIDTQQGKKPSGYNRKGRGRSKR